MLTKRFEPEQKWNLLRQHMAGYFVFFFFRSIPTTLGAR